MVALYKTKFPPLSFYEELCILRQLSNGSPSHTNVEQCEKRILIMNQRASYYRSEQLQNQVIC